MFLSLDVRDSGFKDWGFDIGWVTLSLAVRNPGLRINLRDRTILFDKFEVATLFFVRQRKLFEVLYWF